MARHINDELLKNAAISYLGQIGTAFAANGAADCGVIVIIARPMGAGEFKVFGAGVIDGRQMDGPTQRKLLAALHDESGVIATPTLKLAKS